MVTVKSTVFCIVILGSFERVHFRGHYCFRVQNQRVNHARNWQKQVPLSLLFAAGFLLGLLFGPEDGGDSFPPKCLAVSELENITIQKIILFFLRDGCCSKSSILGFITSIPVCSIDIKA
jgi:hypothetical protein